VKLSDNSRQFLRDLKNLVSKSQRKLKLLQLKLPQQKVLQQRVLQQKVHQPREAMETKVVKSNMKVEIPQPKEETQLQQKEVMLLQLKENLQGFRYGPRPV
jgi:hypothetical protein